MKNIALLFMSIVSLMMIATSGFSQKKDNVVQSAEERIKFYQSQMPAIENSETPEDSWNRFYSQPNPTVNKSIGYHVNMMPSYFQSGTYANFVLNQADYVWGNVNGGTAPYKYYLDYGDGQIDSGTVSDPKMIGTSHTYTFSGQRIAKLLVIDKNGVRDSDETVIRVFPVATNQVRINRAIERGLRYLYTTQNAAGWWYSATGEYGIGSTGMALLAFEENGHRPDNDNNEDIYAEYVRLGLNYLLANPIPYNVYTHNSGNPEEVSSNPSSAQYGYGIVGKGASTGPSEQTYSESCTMLAIIASHTDADGAKTDTIRTGTYASYFLSVKGYYPTYYDFIVDGTETFCQSQNDGVSNTSGGWRYSINSYATGTNGHYNVILESGSNDASANQWPILVFEAASSAWGIEVPGFVKSRAKTALTALQDMNSGGVGYTSNSSWRNSAKTGGAIVGYAWMDSTSSNINVSKGITFISNKWGVLGQGGSDNAGWLGNLYAMYAVKKGFSLINGTGIQTIEYSYNNNTVTRDWYEDFSAFLLGDWSMAGGAPPGSATNYNSTTYSYGQKTNGSWTSAEWPINTTDLNSAASILVLTQGVIVAPPVAVIENISSRPAQLPFDVDGSDSYHQSGQKSIVDYLWDWDDTDGLDWDNPDDFGPQPTNPGYENPGTYTITLRVQDDSDPPLFAMTSVTVTIDALDSELNHAPIAVAIPKNRLPFYATGVGIPVLIDGRDSYDPDLNDEIVSYSWDLNGDGVFGDATTDTVTHILNNEFDGEIGLKVTDTHGATTASGSYLRIVAAQKNIRIKSFEITPNVVFRDSMMHFKVVLENEALSNSIVKDILIRFYDNDPLVSGTRLGRTDYKIATLAIGASDSVEFNMQVPAIFTEGAHFIYAFIDANSQVNEWNEVDNRQSVRVDVGNPNTVTIRKVKDKDAKITTTTDRTLKSWHLSLYRDSVSAGSLVAEKDSSTLVISDLSAGNYIAVEADSTGWNHLLASYDGEESETAGSVSFTVGSGESHVVEFVNYLANSAIVKAFADDDSLLNTSEDRFSTPRRLSIYRGSVSLSNLVLSVESDTMITASGLGDGAYIAVQEDSSSSGWSTIGVILIDQNGNPTTIASASSAVSFTLVGGQTKQVHFINVRSTAITVRKIVDTDGNMNSTDDQFYTPWNLKLYKNNIAPENLVGSTETDSTLKVVDVQPGTYIAIENDSTGFIQLGYQVNGVKTRSRSGQVTFIMKAGERPAIDFVNFMGEAGLYRTFISDSAAFAVKSIKMKTLANKPNSGNVRDTVMKYASDKKINPVGGLLLGLQQSKVNQKLAGWIKLDKGGATKFLPQTGEAQFFDSIRLKGKSTKLFVKELKNPTFKKISNHLAGELFLFAFNLTASERGQFPGGFGNVVYSDQNSSSMFNGMRLSDVKSKVDTIVTLWKDYKETVDITEVDTVVSRINRAFYRPLADSDFVPFVATTKEFLILTSVRSVFEVDYLLPATSKGSVVRNQANIDVPEKIELYQNYPNPFNPTTTIEFFLPEDGIVKLKVFNVLGQEVATVLNNVGMESGYHSVDFDAAHLASGVYFVRLEVPGQHITPMTKIMLLK